MRVEYVGLKTACGRRQPRNCQEVCLSTDADTIERQVRREQFGIGSAATREEMADELVERGAAHQPSQKRLGTRHFRRRDRVQYPRRAARA